MMSSVLTPSPPTAARFPESEQLYEVVDGVRVEKAVSAASIWIANELTVSMKPHATAEGLGTVVMEMVFILDAERDLRRRPDVAFVSVAKWPVGKMPPIDGDWAIIPNLAIEVISPNNRFSEIIRKLHEYFDYGVSEVWLVMPEERLVQVYQTPDDIKSVRVGEDLKSELIPNWSIPVSMIIPETADVPETTPE